MLDKSNVKKRWANSSSSRYGFQGLIDSLVAAGLKLGADDRSHYFSQLYADRSVRDAESEYE